MDPTIALEIMQLLSQHYADWPISRRYKEDFYRSLLNATARWPSDGSYLRGRVVASLPEVEALLTGHAELRYSQLTSRSKVRQRSTHGRLLINERWLARARRSSNRAALEEDALRSRDSVHRLRGLTQWCQNGDFQLGKWHEELAVLRTTPKGAGDCRSIVL